MTKEKTKIILYYIIALIFVLIFTLLLLNTYLKEKIVGICQRVDGDILVIKYNNQNYDCLRLLINGSLSDIKYKKCEQHGD